MPFTVTMRVAYSWEALRSYAWDPRSEASVTAVVQVGNHGAPIGARPTTAVLYSAPSAPTRSTCASVAVVWPVASTTSTPASTFIW